MMSQPFSFQKVQIKKEKKLASVFKVFKLLHFKKPCRGVYSDEDTLHV